MKDIIDNQKDEEIRQSRVWAGKAMAGRWDGNGRWHLEDKTWNGNGTWEGGLLHGTWNIKGKWESISNDRGDWNGRGDLVCNMAFLRHIENYIIVLALILNGLVFALGYFHIGNWLNTAIISLIIMVLAILSIWITRSTNKGKLWLGGTWEDIGEYRILYIKGRWRLGYHEGTISGKLKDPKPI